MSSKETNQKQRPPGCNGAGDEVIMAFIEFNNVVKEYPAGSTTIRALNGASFTADEGKLTVILGQSGAGKTTALNILGGMDTATSGKVTVGGVDITNFNHNEQIQYRRNSIGFVFQFYNLVANLTALENVELASQICQQPLDPAQTLRNVGGEQQRVSIARAIAKNPRLLLCDEPTGALDYETGKEVLKLLQRICVDEGHTVLIITHNAALAPMAHKIVRFRSGQVVSEETNPDPTPISEIEW